MRTAAIVGNGFTFTGHGDPELAVGHLVSGEFFDLLGVTPALGRTFGTAEEAATTNDLIVLSHGFWQRRFGGDPNIIGRTITANNRSFTVLGVMKPDFSFQGPRYQFWMPLPLRGPNPDKLPINRNSRFVQVLAKLDPAVSPDAAAAELRSVAAALEQAYPEAHTNTSFLLSSLTEETVGNVRSALQLLFAAVLLVLLVACGNVTSLLLARFTVRGAEVLVRGRARGEPRPAGAAIRHRNTRALYRRHRRGDRVGGVASEPAANVRTGRDSTRHGRRAGDAGPGFRLSRVTRGRISVRHHAGLAGDTRRLCIGHPGSNGDRGAITSARPLDDRRCADRRGAVPARRREPRRTQPDQSRTRGQRLRRHRPRHVQRRHAGHEISRRTRDARVLPAARGCDRRAARIHERGYDDGISLERSGSRKQLCGGWIRGSVARAGAGRGAARREPWLHDGHGDPAPFRARVHARR